MRTFRGKAVLTSIWTILLIAVLAACGSDSSDGKTVAVNLSLIVDSRQANHRTPLSRLFAFLEQWFPDAAPAWGQTVSEIRSIQVQITGPGIPTPASTTVPVSNPTSGQEIPVTIQAPVGPNRTITVSAFNSANAKIFGGTVPNVNLTAGAPVDVVVTLVRLFIVTVEKQGSGSGTIRSTPPGIDCEPSCPSQQGQFEEGTEVVLSAPTPSGSAFAGWSGDCTGTDDCTVRGESRVSAQFDSTSTNHLHVDKGGTGTGTVMSAPNGIYCGVSCDSHFVPGTVVRLTALPASGSAFTNWSGGGCSGGVPTCDVSMNGDQSVAAIFSVFVPPPTSTLRVQKGGLGSGTVTSTPTGIDCGGRCSAQFPQDNTVTLTATPGSGSTFVGWGGACSGSSGPSCTVAMNTDQIVSVQFDLSAFVTLTVTKSGGGSGTVTDNPVFGVINCGSTCVAQYIRGTPVTLTATPDPGSTFNEWRSAPCNNDPTPQCVVTMDRDRTMEANFSAPGGG